MNGIPRVAIALAALLALCLLLPACGGQEPVPRLPALSSDARILAFGDSLTSGSGAGNAESYPAVLSELLGHEVINAGNPGELSASGLDRITTVLERERPDLLLLCHGGNDLLRGRSTERLAANLAAMIRAARDRDIPVILIGVPARAWPIRTADVYRDVAGDAGVPTGGFRRGTNTPRREPASRPHPSQRGGVPEACRGCSRFTDTSRGRQAGALSHPRDQHLARISHRPSTTHADLLAVNERTPSSRLDAVSATPSPSSGPCPPSQRHLDALAKNGGEKCGPGDAVA